MSSIFCTSPICSEDETNFDLFKKDKQHSFLLVAMNFSVEVFASQVTPSDAGRILK